MFEKTLTDVVKGIRASKRDTALYISQCIAEIKTEISSSDMYVKANALQKLTFLQMMGYSMNWASFATIEVMSSPRFANKRIGYLAASQGFTQDTEVILLTTNLLKKELRGAVGGGMNGVYEAGLAINCISNIVTEDLARDLLPEVTNLAGHPQPYLRKKAILCLFKLFVKYPQGLRLTFTKLQQCLNDQNSSVVSCAVNVITELSDKNPKNYLQLAPAFFDLLTQSNNNWMLIKVVKLLGSLVPEEPRLARKLLEPLAEIVKNTQAKSLLYEAVYTVTLCLPYCRKSDGSMPPVVPDIVLLCAQTLRSFVEDNDQNLKYLGLVGFASLMQSHPRVLSAPDYRPLILACLSDQDVTIRTRALDLLKGMTSRKNLMELVTQLLKHVEMATGIYKNDLVAKIIDMCSAEKYALLPDFAWYLDILFQLGHLRGVEGHAPLLRAQVMDVALRVLPVRAYAVRRSVEVLLERDGIDLDDSDDEQYGDNGRGKHIMPEILPALAWIIGEYADLFREALSLGDKDEEFSYDKTSQGAYHSLIQVLTAPGSTKDLPTSTQQVYVQSAMKVFAAAATDSKCSKTELEASLRSIQSNMCIYTQSTDVELVERSFTALELLRCLKLTETGLPGLVDASDDSDGSGHGDLLGLTAQQRAPKALDTKENQLLVSRIREASGTLNYLFKPSPMKPVGSKAQRKKHSSATGVDIDLSAPVNLSVFEDFIAEEERYRSTSKLSLESVSFTQQRPMQVQDAPLTSLSSGPIEFPVASKSQGAVTDSSYSFQKPMVGSLGGTVPRQRQGDPFYLDSTPNSNPDTEAPREDSRFGTIQLFDSDEEHEGGDNKRKKKEKRAKRSKAKQASATADFSGSLLSFGMNEQQPAANVYESDDEDEFIGAGLGRHKKTGKEFDGLAKVDLTTPLREDEVMPERKHRVVPERPPTEVKMSKAKRKTKKNKKKSDRAVDGGDEVGDLLGLGGFEAASTARPAPSAAVSSNPDLISTAFDDLLDLSAPAPAPLLSLSRMATTATNTATAAAPASSPPVSSSQSHKRPWMLASVKLSTASPGVDWSQIRLTYRLYRTSGGTLAASLLFRLHNNSSQTLSDAVLELNGIGRLSLGNVSVGASVESTKMGPVAFSDSSSVECKGTLSGSGSTVGFKATASAALQLNPLEVTLEQVAEELSSGDWSSQTVKLHSMLPLDAVQQLVGGFLRAHQVDATTQNATFAAMSSASHASVFLLLKLKDGSVKVDIRSSDAVLSKSLASDMKRLVLSNE